MIKKHLKTLVLSSIITLLPIPVGFALWDALPDTLAIHFGASGEANGFSTKLFAILLPPVILLITNLLLFFLSNLIDRKNAAQNPKLQKLVLYIIPLLSLLVSGSIYAVALDFNLSPLLPAIISLPCGLLMLTIGNYLPKCRQNFTMGIKISTTLESEENWNATHRLGGKVWFICGLLMLPCALIPMKYVSYILAVLFAAAILIPVIYSYIYRAKHPDSVDAKKAEQPRHKRIAIIITAVFLPLLVLLFIVLMFTGSIYTGFDDAEFSVKSTYAAEVSLSYDDIDKVEFFESCDAGHRVFGFGSAKLLLGTFENKEFGRHTRYSYTGEDSCIAITAKDGSILAVGGKDADETKEIYERLKEAINESN